MKTTTRFCCQTLGCGLMLLLFSCTSPATLKTPDRIMFEDTMTSDWQENWFLDGEKGTVEHRDGGLFLEAGPLTKQAERDLGVDPPVEYNAHHIVLWTRQVFDGDIRISYEYTEEADSTYTNLIYIQAQGTGEAPFLEDLTAWNALREIPGMDMYYNHMDLISISLRDEIRCRRYPWNNPDKGEEFASRLFEPMVPHPGLEKGVRHQVLIEKRAASLRLMIRQQESGNLVIDHSWDLTENMDDRAPRLITRGRIGQRLMGGHKLTMWNFKVERL